MSQLGLIREFVLFSIFCVFDMMNVEKIGCKRNSRRNNACPSLTCILIEPFDRKEGEEPTLQNMLRGHKVMSEIYVRRLPLDEVPDDDEGASKYLHDLYRTKVELEYLSGVICGFLLAKIFCGYQIIIMLTS